jgi:hypothetical protein
MDTGGLPETLLRTYKTARRDIPQDNDQFFPRVVVPPCLCRNGKYCAQEQRCKVRCLYPVHFFPRAVSMPQT